MENGTSPETGQVSEPSVALFTATLEGHRQSYLVFFKDLFAGHRVSQESLIRAPDPLLCLMIEDGFGRYFATAAARALFGRRTVGLLFRPIPALIGKSFRLRLKRILLRFLKTIPRVKTLSIVPFSAQPGIDKICDNWIFDPQLWDITARDLELFTSIKLGRSSSSELHALLNSIRHMAAGRRVLISIGVQSTEKGLDILAAAANSNSLDGWLVVAAGKFTEATQEAKKELERTGHLVIDRFLSDEELIAAYAVADLTWCLYDPSYDQASGILGRAIQFGVPALVRSGSVSQHLCLEGSIPHIAAADVNEVASALDRFNGLNHDIGQTLTTNYRNHSVTVLEQALYGQGLSN